MKEKFLFFIVLLSNQVLSQEPKASFALPNEVCINQGFYLNNTSENAISYNWDFCIDEFQDTLEIANINNIQGGNRILGIDFIYIDNVWYGIATSWGNNKIFRLTFGSGIDKPATLIETLGNPDNVLAKPVSIGLLEQNDTVYALVHNWTSGLTKITFKDGINGQMQKGSVISPSFGSAISKMELINTTTELTALVVNTNSIIEIIDFENNINKVIKETDIVSAGVITGISDTRDIEAIQFDGNWYVFVSSFSTGQIARLDFDNDLMSGIKNIELNVADNIFNNEKPNNIEITRDGRNIILHVLTFEGNLYKVNFGTDIKSTNISEIVAYGEQNRYREGYNLKFFKSAGNWHGFVIDDLKSSLYHIRNTKYCGSSIAYTKDTNPFIKYLAPGIFDIQLQAIAIDGIISDTTKTITIKSQSAPNTYFTTANACISTPNSFSAASSDDPSITSWNWNFGDGIGTSTEQNPSYQYQNPGDYLVSLNVAADNGCTNSVSDSIYIYNPPIANFTYPLDVICSNSQLEFTNNTVFFGPDSILTYQWNMNNETIIEDANPSYNFTSGGDKNITLSASIPGCSSELSQMINITAGPAVSFLSKGTCVYEDFSFTNNTTGEDITGYQWDFGDGYFSTNDSPIHRYASGGNYIASLTASNALGCNTKLEQVIAVKYIPDLFFTNDLACSDNLVNLFDQSTVVDANISKRYWTINKQDIGYLQTSNGPSPSFLLESEGFYDVTLISESNYGCKDTLSRQIEVNKSPAADFIFENTCLGDSTLLHENVELPEGTNLISAEWLIGGNLYSQEEVKHKFLTPSEQEVELYVRASNLCPDNVTKNINILPLPEIDFSLSDNCEDQLVLLNSMVNATMDPVVSYNWMIDNKPVSTQANFQYEFNKADDYAVGLSVSTENNCYNTVSKSIDINPSPSSKFDVFPSIGASPLNVHFTDRSKGAQNISYLFSHYNEDGSIEENPSYTYINIGEDVATQIVANEFGCTDTSTQAIEVVIPIYDISISNVALEVVDESLKFMVSLQNNGSIIINNPVLKIKIADKISLTQKIETSLRPGDQREYAIDFAVINNVNEPLNYVCFSITELLGAYQDVNPEDNAQCLNIDQSFNVLEPFPNPSRAFIQIPIILPNEGDCDLEMISDHGTLVYVKKFSNLQSGLNMITLDLTLYRKGVYLLNMKLSDFETTKKIVIQ